MEIWLDTADFELIEKMNDTIEIHGITTNPSIMAQSGLNFKDTINKLLNIQKGAVAIQVLSNDYIGMTTEALNIYQISNRIIIKIPATSEGFKAMKYLAKQNIPVLSTAVFDLRQLILSINIGAKYIAPYFGRINDYEQIISDMKNIIVKSNSPLKIMGASIKNISYVVNSAKIGIDAITLPYNILNEMLIDNNQTLQSIDKFNLDWNQWEFKSSFCND